MTSDCFFWTDMSGIHNVKLYPYKELRAATTDFSQTNKIGEGGFGSVYKVNTDVLFNIYFISSFCMIIMFWRNSN